MKGGCLINLYPIVVLCSCRETGFTNGGDVLENLQKGEVDAFITRFAHEGAMEEAVEAALCQIDEKGYLVPWRASGKQLVKVGAVFDPATRTLGKLKQGE
jgi:hypothetical protein